MNSDACIVGRSSVRPLPTLPTKGFLLIPTKPPGLFTAIAYWPCRRHALFLLECEPIYSGILPTTKNLHAIARIYKYNL